MKRLLLVTNAILVCVCLILPLRAHAATTIKTAKPGWGAAGMVGNTAEFVVQPWDGTPCQFIVLGTGGLSDWFTILGTTGNDWFGFIGNTTTFCGTTMTPLNQNGFALDFNGWTGDDVLNGGFQPNYVYGYDGNDILQVAAAYDAEAHGGAGNDKIIGSNHGTDGIWGDWDNDTICIPSNKVASNVDGGGGTDLLCGSSDTVTGVETTQPSNCSACQ
jgi:hypothetical protein